MKCNKCGKEVPHNAKQCPHCGHTLAAKPAAQPKPVQNHYAKPQANPYAKPPAARQNLYQKPPAPKKAAPSANHVMHQEKPMKAPTAAPSGANGAAAAKKSKGNVGLIVGISVGAFLLFVGIIVAILISVFSGSGNSEPVADFTQQETAFVESMDEDFTQTEAQFLNDDGYVAAENVNEALNAVYTQAQSMVEEGKIASAELEESGCVRIEMTDGLIYIYEPPVEGMNASGGIKRIVSLQPFRKEQKLTTADDVAQEAADCGVGFEFAAKDNLDNEKVTIEAAKKLKGSAVVIWDGHGGYTRYEKSYVVTSVNAKKALNDSRYKEDFRLRRLVVKHASNQKPLVCITASFFDYYYKPGDFDDTLFFFTTCHSADDMYLANVLKTKGAGAVFANKNSIYTKYINKMMESIFYDLTGFKTAGKALKNAKKKYGNVDTDYFPNLDKGSPAAEVMLLGDNAESYKLYKDVTDNNADTADNADTGNLKSKVLGKWYMEDYTSMEGESTLEFFKDNTAKSTFNYVGETVTNATYTQKGDYIQLTYEDGRLYNVYNTVSENVLIYEYLEGGFKSVLTKFSDANETQVKNQLLNTTWSSDYFGGEMDFSDSNDSIKVETSSGSLVGYGAVMSKDVAMFRNMEDMQNGFPDGVYIELTSNPNVLNVYIFDYIESTRSTDYTFETWEKVS